MLYWIEVDRSSTGGENETINVDLDKEPSYKDIVKIAKEIGYNKHCNLSYGKIKTMKC